MKISKIFLFTAAALALCGACDDSDDKVDPSTTEDKISVSPMEGVVGSNLKQFVVCQKFHALLKRKRCGRHKL